MSTSTPVTGRAARAVTGGCLVALTVLILAAGTVLAWMVYAFHRADTGNESRREEARTVLAEKARHAAALTVRDLTAAPDADREAAEDIVLRTARDPGLGQGTVAPKVTYDKALDGLTAVGLFSGSYEVRPALWGARRPESVTRCYALAFRHDSGTWQAKVTTRPDRVCAQREAVTNGAQAAREALRAIDRTTVTRDQVRRLLDPVRTATYEVTTVTGQGRTVTVTTLVRAAGDEQCYRFVRHTDSQDQDSVTVAAVAVAHCAG
ncbi:hypothetical protein [Streptomyces sp. NPDC005374]|uniref:hypothetical protein n=1 Tax=Streptomyces sp. NPDC005374 TaxID=3364713 RepID=UPI00369D8875